MSEETTVVHLRPVDIKPPLWKDPVTMLRGLIEEIEAGTYGDINTVAIAILSEGAEDGEPVSVFSGGRNSDLAYSVLALASAQARLLGIATGVPT
jgi:hypothetical protein